MLVLSGGNVPKVMKAAFVLSVDEVAVDEVAVPSLDADDVLVRVLVCGVCASDVKFVKGLKTYRETSFGRGFPGFTGHEWVGKVVATGENVTGFRPGDRVVPFLIKSCGMCRFCRRGRVNLCGSKTYVHGGFAEYVKAPLKNLIKIPEAIDAEDACLVEPLACCLHGLEKLELEKDSLVLMLGDGPMGLLNTILLKAFGMRVVVAGRREHRLSTALKLGADHAVNVREKDLREKVLKLSDGVGADAVVLAINNPSAVETALRLVSKGGTLNILAGAHPDYDASFNPNKIHYGEITITGSADAYREHYVKAVELIKTRKVKPSATISNTYTLNETGDAFKTAMAKTGNKVVVKP
ncbi:MAG: alcohol dehydrogenase catalytic domain-containing protein [Nitrososphaerota archaeon]